MSKQSEDNVDHSNPVCNGEFVLNGRSEVVPASENSEEWTFYYRDYVYIDENGEEQRSNTYPRECFKNLEDPTQNAYGTDDESVRPPRPEYDFDNWGGAVPPPPEFEGDNWNPFETGAVPPPEYDFDNWGDDNFGYGAVPPPPEYAGYN